MDQVETPELLEMAAKAAGYDYHPQNRAIVTDAIARLVEPGTIGKWHGINCYVRTFDSDTIEVRESVSEIMGQIKSAQEISS